MSQVPDPSFGSEARVILIVVDDPTHRLIFNRHLKDTPHHVVYAVDGEDGFDRFAEAKPHLVIAQVDVARLEGTILCQLIRQQPRGAAVPVVLLSEDFSDPEEARQRVAAVGADAHLQWPFDLPDLRGVLTPLLESGRDDQARIDTPAETQAAPPATAPRESAEIAFNSVLSDFMDQTDEASSAREAVTDSEVKAAQRSKESPDVDTVVAFNPFLQEPNGPLAALEAMAESSSDTLDAAQIEPPLGLDEPPTPVRRRISPGSDPAVPVEGSPPPVAADRMPTSSGEKSVSQPASDDDFGRAAGRPDPLEEPKITPSADSGVHIRLGAPGKSQLIREVPKEITPSQSDAPRVSQVQKRAGGQRRGLDESQLGKRLSKRVRNMFRLLDEVDYYQLLGVERSAEEEALRRAYFELSLEFHPDRFFLLRSGDLKEKIYVIYRRIAEAYRVLSDDRKRRAYNEARSLSSAKRATPELRGDSGSVSVVSVPTPTTAFAAVAQSDAGERFVNLARAAYERQDYNHARLHLSLARTYEPDNASLHAAVEHVVRQLTPTL